MNKKTLIWTKFLAEEAKDYTETTGVSIKEIKAVGHKKFIEANGWESPSDVSKWRTDLLHVMPCPHCHNDFGIMDDFLGLCDKCLPLFDLNAFYTDLNNLHVSQNSGFVDGFVSKANLIGKAIVAFMMDKKLRNHYLKKSINNEAS